MKCDINILGLSLIHFIDPIIRSIVVFQHELYGSEIKVTFCYGL